MSDEPVLDSVQPGDDAAIASVINAVRAADGDAEAGFDHAWTSDETTKWREGIEAGGGGFVVARFAGSVVGFGTLEPVDAGVGSLGVWVTPAQRRRGLGTDLARGVLDLAREKGFKRVRGKMLQGEAALSFLGSIGALVPMVNPEMEFELPL